MDVTDEKRAWMIGKRVESAMHMVESGQFRGTVEQYLGYLRYRDDEERAAVFAEWQRRTGKPVTE